MIRTLIAAGAAGAVAAPAGAQTFDFNSLVHGEIVNNQFAPALTVSGVIPNRGFDLVAAFNTGLSGTADPDLEGPSWAGGNLDAGFNFGMALIIAENNNGAGDGMLDNPDDEGRRPAGSVNFVFDRDYNSLGFDLIDIENEIIEASSIEFFNDGNLVGTVDFADFVTNGTSVFDASISFGNNHVNRINPITGFTYDEVTFNLGGSAAIDNLVVPAPGVAALFAAGLGVAARRRRA